MVPIEMFSPCFFILVSFVHPFFFVFLSYLLTEEVVFLVLHVSSSLSVNRIY